MDVSTHAVLNLVQREKMHHALDIEVIELKFYTTMALPLDYISPVSIGVNLVIRLYIFSINIGGLCLKDDIAPSLCSVLSSFGHHLPVLTLERYTPVIKLSPCEISAQTRRY